MKIKNPLSKASFNSVAKYCIIALTISALYYEKKGLENDNKKLESDLEYNEVRCKAYQAIAEKETK